MRFLSLSTTHYRWMALLWTGGLIAAFSIPAASLTPVRPALTADKAIHFGLFVIFGLLWMRVLCPPPARTLPHLRRQGLRLLGWGSLFAGGTEVYQHLLPLQRQGDPYDALADGSGMLIAVIVYAIVARRRSVSDESPAN